MMKDKQTLNVSRYTFFVEHDNRKFLYNTLSNALTEVDDELYNYLKSTKTNHIDLSDSLDNALIESLRDNKHLTENDEDDFLIYKSVIPKFWTTLI